MMLATPNGRRPHTVSGGENTSGQVDHRQLTSCTEQMIINGFSPVGKNDSNNNRDCKSDALPTSEPMANISVPRQNVPNVSASIAIDPLSTSIVGRMDALKSTSAVNLATMLEVAMTDPVVRFSYDKPSSSETELRPKIASPYLCQSSLHDESKPLVTRPLAKRQNCSSSTNIASASTSDADSVDVKKSTIGVATKKQKQPNGNSRMVVPERASSFNIHPGRCCSEICQLCSTKFGLLDTPQHLSQIKIVQVAQRSEEDWQMLVQFVQSIAAIPMDACLCDRCYRFLGTSLKTRSKQQNQDIPTPPPPSHTVNGDARSGSQEDRGQAIVTSGVKESPAIPPKAEQRSCIVKSCQNMASHNFYRKWLIRLRHKLCDVDIDWSQVDGSNESGEVVGCGRGLSLFCSDHSELVTSLMRCSLCFSSIVVARWLGSGDNVLDSDTAKLRECANTTQSSQQTSLSSVEDGTADPGDRSSLCTVQRQTSRRPKRKNRGNAWMKPKSRAEIFESANKFLTTRLSADQVELMTQSLASDGISSDLTVNSFLCKLCRLFCVVHCRATQAGDAAWLQSTGEGTSESGRLQFYRKYHDKLVAMSTSPKAASDTSRATADGSSSGDDGQSGSDKKPSPKIMIRVSKSGTLSSTDTTESSVANVATSETVTSELADSSVSAESLVAQKLPPTTGATAGQSRMRKRRRQHRPFASPSGEDRMRVEPVEVANPVYPPCISEMPTTSEAPASTETKQQDGADRPNNNLPCSLRIQMDGHTRRLWQEMQHPYSSPTSLFRHLLLLEKYWRNGDLSVADTASSKATAYLQSVKKRVNAYSHLYRRTQEELSEATLPDKSLAMDDVKAADDVDNVHSSNESTSSCSSTVLHSVGLKQQLLDEANDDIQIISESESVINAISPLPPNPPPSVAVNETQFPPRVKEVRPGGIRVAKFAFNPIAGVAVSDEAHNVYRDPSVDSSVNLSFNNSISELLQSSSTNTSQMRLDKANHQPSLSHAPDNLTNLSSSLSIVRSSTKPISAHPQPYTHPAHQLTSKPTTSRLRESVNSPVNLLNVGPNISVFRQQRNKQPAPKFGPEFDHGEQGGRQFSSQSMDMQLMMLMRQSAANMALNRVAGTPGAPDPNASSVNRRGPSILRRSNATHNPNTNFHHGPVVGNVNGSHSSTMGSSVGAGGGGGRCLVLPNGLTVSASNVMASDNDCGSNSLIGNNQRSTEQSNSNTNSYTQFFNRYQSNYRQLDQQR